MNPVTKIPRFFEPEVEQKRIGASNRWQVNFVRKQGQTLSPVTDRKHALTNNVQQMKEKKYSTIFRTGNTADIN
jgi:hypothetical protein